MSDINPNVILIVLGIIAFFIVIFYLNRNNQQPIPNEGSLPKDIPKSVPKGILKKPTRTLGSVGSVNSDEISDGIVNDFISDYDTHADSYASATMSDDYRFSDGIDCTDDSDNIDNIDDRDFTYGKKKFTRRTNRDIMDRFDVDKMLPQEHEDDWFDDEPLQSVKKIKGTHLIHPKAHMGVDTVGTSNKYASHDIRGDIPNPKVSVSPWMNSTIEPLAKPNGICYNRK